MGKIKPQILLTFIAIDKGLKTPVYKQLYNELKSGILNGMLKPGDRLPSSREMCREFGVSRNTVLQVFGQLEAEGFLTGQTGAGTYVNVEINLFRKSSKAGKIKQPGHETLSRPNGLNNVLEGQNSAAEPARPFQVSVPLVKAFPWDVWARITAAVYREAPHMHLGYDDAQGYAPLREALAAHLRISRSINCEADQILIVNGSRQAIHLAAELLLSEGDECWMEDPGYNGAKSAFKRFGGIICPVPITENGIDLDYATGHFPTAKMVYVTPSHQYPLGSTLLLSQRVRLLNWAAGHRMWVIEDDYDSEFRYNSRPIPALQGLDTKGNVIYIGTFSKVLLPALRMGYMVFPSTALARRFTIAKAVTDGQSAVMNQAIVAEFIKEGHFSRHIRRMRLLYKEAQDTLIVLIKKHLDGLLTPVAVEAGMHLVAFLPEGMDAEAISAEAEKRGIYLQTINQYSLEFKYPNGLVLGFAGYLPQEMERTIVELKGILAKQ
jgi:GntR family transcriptional regulator/MocR family aminotransferase